jgi:hypothetical protein
MGELKTKGLPAAFDEQIKTPEHDKLCLKLLDQEFLLKFINDSGIDEKINSQLEICVDRLKKTNVTIKSEYITTTKELTSDKWRSSYTGHFILKQYSRKFKSCKILIEPIIKMENPIISNKFLIGVADFLLTIKYELQTTYEEKEEIIKTDSFTIVDSSAPQFFNYDQKVKYPNLINSLVGESKKDIVTTSSYLEYFHNPIEYHIEVKPKIQSLGEVMRQIRIYEQYGRLPVVLFTTKEESRNIFQSQKILFSSLENIEPQPKQLGISDFNE